MVSYHKETREVDKVITDLLGGSVTVPQRIIGGITQWWAVL